MGKTCNNCVHYFVCIVLKGIGNIPDILCRTIKGGEIGDVMTDLKKTIALKCQHYRKQ